MRSTLQACCTMILNANFLESAVLLSAGHVRACDVCCQCGVLSRLLVSTTRLCDSRSITFSPQLLNALVATLGPEVQVDAAVRAMLLRLCGELQRLPGQCFSLSPIRSFHVSVKPENRLTRDRRQCTARRPAHPRANLCLCPSPRGPACAAAAARGEAVRVRVLTSRLLTCCRARWPVHTLRCAARPWPPCARCVGWGAHSVACLPCLSEAPDFLSRLDRISCRWLTGRQVIQREPDAIRTHGSGTERSLLKMLDSEVRGIGVRPVCL
jgi:hypothetical protein